MSCEVVNSSRKMVFLAAHGIADAILHLVVVEDGKLVVRLRSLRHLPLFHHADTSASQLRAITFVSPLHSCVYTVWWLHALRAVVQHGQAQASTALALPMLHVLHTCCM